MTSDIFTEVGIQECCCNLTSYWSKTSLTLAWFSEVWRVAMVASVKVYLGTWHSVMSLAGNWRDSLHYLGRGNYFGEARRSSLKNERITIITKIQLRLAFMISIALLHDDFFISHKAIMFLFFLFSLKWSFQLCNNNPELFFSHFWWSENHRNVTHKTHRTHFSITIIAFTDFTLKSKLAFFMKE